MALMNARILLGRSWTASAGAKLPFLDAVAPRSSKKNLQVNWRFGGRFFMVGYNEHWLVKTTYY